MMTVTFGE